MSDPTQYMNEAQRAAYGAPVREEDPPAAPDAFRHREVYDRVPMWVILAAYVGEEYEREYGSRGIWYCSISVWRRSARSPFPIKPKEWQSNHHRAARKMREKYLANVGEDTEPALSEGEYVLHCALPMNAGELADLGLLS